jgi:hypothetical protein
MALALPLDGNVTMTTSSIYVTVGGGEFSIFLNPMFFFKRNQPGNRNLSCVQTSKWKVWAFEQIGGIQNPLLKSIHTRVGKNATKFVCPI